MDMATLSQIFMVIVAIEVVFVLALAVTGRQDSAMLMVGRLALLDWALAFAGIGLLLVLGQSTVAFNALDAGRMSEAIMQFVFMTLVVIGTCIAAGLFIIVGVLRE